MEVFEVIVMVESLNATSISSSPPKAADGGGQSDDDSSVSSGDSVSNILGDRSTEIRQWLNTDEGITEYFIREYGPKSVAASTKLLQSVKMASSADCSSFSAAVQFVSDFTASLKWCRAFLPKKKIRIKSFLEGIFPVALREALILNGYFSMSGVIRDFLQAYKEAVNSSVLLRSYGVSISPQPDRTFSKNKGSNSGNNNNNSGVSNNINTHDNNNRGSSLPFTKKFTSPGDKNSGEPNTTQNKNNRSPGQVSFKEEAPSVTCSICGGSDHKYWKCPSRSGSSSSSPQKPDPKPEPSSGRVSPGSSGGSGTPLKSALKSAPKDGPATATRSKTGAKPVTSKMILLSQAQRSDLPVVSLSIGDLAGEELPLALMANLDSCSGANFIGAAWLPVLAGIGVVPYPVDPVGVGWMDGQVMFEATEAVSLCVKLTAYEALAQVHTLQFLVARDAAPELIIGMPSLRQTLYLQHMDDIMCVQRALGLLVSTPSWLPDPVIEDMNGQPIDVEEREDPPVLERPSIRRRPPSRPLLSKIARTVYRDIDLARNLRRSEDFADHMREYSGHLGPSVKVADRELPEDVAQAM